MTVKRIKDEAGILPDGISVQPDGSPEDLVAIREILAAASPTARIEALRRHDDLVEIADVLLQSFNAAGKASMQLLRQIAGAEFKALYLDVAPIVVRDNARQAGTQQPRRPDVDDWISSQLNRDPSAKSPQLWSVAPEWLTDQIGSRRFATRVTAARKMTRK